MLWIVPDEKKREKEFYEQHNSDEEKKLKKESKENKETGNFFSWFSEEKNLVSIRYSERKKIQKLLIVSKFLSFITISSRMTVYYADQRISLVKYDRLIISRFPTKHCR